MLIECLMNVNKGFISIKNKLLKFLSKINKISQHFSLFMNVYIAFNFKTF